MEDLALLDGDLSNRGCTDWRIGFWKAFALSMITFGIYGAYVLYKLLERREQHFERMASLRRHLLDILRARAGADGRGEELGPALDELGQLDRGAASRDRYGEKTPVLWLVLGILTGVTNFYVYYFLNDDFYAHGASESAFFDKAASLMAALGIDWDAPAMAAVPKRPFARYLLLTLLTLGLYGIYWWYTLITDPDRHFEAHNRWEPGLRAALGFE